MQGSPFSRSALECLYVCVAEDYRKAGPLFDHSRPIRSASLRTVKIWYFDNDDGYIYFRNYYSRNTVVNCSGRSGHSETSEKARGVFWPSSFRAHHRALQATTPSSLTRGMARRSLSTAPVRLEHILIDCTMLLMWRLGRKTTAKLVRRKYKSYCDAMTTTIIRLRTATTTS